MKDNKFLLYGANGYTGELIARYAANYNLIPILAGRRESVIKPMAEKLNVEYRVFSLEQTSALEAALRDVKVVIHAAGPFDVTAKPMIDACLKTGTHYLDINGDLDVFQMLKKEDTAAKEEGIMILPGAGFDVVPTDCLSLFLKNLLPDATSLKIAFATPGGGLSHGTAVTTISKLGEPGAVRINGKIVSVPVGHKSLNITFEGKSYFMMAIPWGDVFTAFETTGIQNIESYTNVSPAVYYIAKLQGLFNWLLKTQFVKKLARKMVDNQPAGLDDAKREKSTSIVWGEVINDNSHKVEARLFCPDAYSLTAFTCLLITQKILKGNFKTGYQTPAAVYGADLIMEIAGVRRVVGTQ